MFAIKLNIFINAKANTKLLTSHDVYCSKMFDSVIK